MIRTLAVLLAFGLAMPWPWPVAAAHSAALPSSQHFFPGFYPASTWSWASHLQHAAGRDAWLTDPRSVTLAFARAEGWPANPQGIRVTQPGPRSARVVLPRAGNPALNMIVDVRRINSAPGRVWFVTAVASNNLRLTAPASGSTIPRSFTVRGTASLFEGQFDLSLLTNRRQTLWRHHMTITGMTPSWFAIGVHVPGSGAVIVRAASWSPRDGSLLNLAMIKLRVVAP